MRPYVGDEMKVLIVESEPNLGRLWQNHMQRQGIEVRLVTDQPGAAMALHAQAFDIIVLDLVISRGSAFAIADLASYRHPETQIIFVTNTSFFSDGSIFNLSANACAFLQSDTPPEDLTAMVQHYGGGVKSPAAHAVLENPVPG
jgi:DNA-binding NtrC family response regulator